MDVATRVMGNNYSKKLWETIRDLFAAHNGSNVVYYKKELRQTQKRGMKVDEYLITMKSDANKLAIAGHPITRNDLISQVLSGLNSNECNLIYANIMNSLIYCGLNFKQDS
ncbi:hypothetical protein Ddye_022696 [Dipteronia dyeriana]|uniref:Uncharacterized protein n=1 Tax=Dipteronia dyeriana TaxID=168575 RepID=A0AAD9TS39_9ROSI|nr:hypothetical protein Ddye_022696 [Dipteronia dyeriana]